MSAKTENKYLSPQEKEALFHFRERLDAHFRGVNQRTDEYLVSIKNKNNHEKIKILSGFIAVDLPIKKAARFMAKTQHLISTQLPEIITEHYTCRLPSLSVEKIKKELRAKKQPKLYLNQVCVIAKLKQDAEHRLIKKHMDMLKVEKATPQYIQFIEVNGYPYGRIKHRLDIKKLAPDVSEKNEIHPRHIMSILHHNVDCLSMGLNRWSTLELIGYDTTPVTHKIKQLLEVKGVVMRNTDILTFTIKPTKSRVVLEIYKDDQRLDLLTLSNDIPSGTLWMNEAEIRALLGVYLAKGIKIKKLQCAYIENNMSFSNYTDYDSISLVLNSSIKQPDNLYQKGIVTLNKDRTWSVTDLYGVKDEALIESIIKKHNLGVLASENDIFERLFLSNKRFALHTIKEFIVLDESKHPSGIFFH